MSFPLLRFLFFHMKPYRWHYMVMISAPLITGFYPFAYHYSIKMLLDLMEQGSTLTYDKILFPIVLFVGAQLTLDLTWRLSQIAEWKSEPYVRRSILLKSYDYVQHHSYRFFQNNFTGAITSKLKGLLDGYDKFWAECHHGFLSRLFSTVISLSALFLIHKALGLLMVGWCGLYIPLMYTLSKRLNALSYQETESRHKLIGYISDKVMNIMSLFCFATRQQEIKNLDSHISKDFVPKQIKTYKYDFKVQLVGGLLYTSILTILLFYMIHLRQQNAVTLGDFAFVFSITMASMENIWRLTISLQDFARSMGDFKSALTLLEAPHDMKDPEDAVPINIANGHIVFQDVSFGYHNGQKVFDGLTLSVSPGEKVGLIGPSGAGKSSLVNLLLKYFHPQEGDILIDNQSLQKVQQDSLRSQITVIPQDIVLFHRSLYDNIAYGNLSATEEEVIEAAKKAQLHDYIMSLPHQYQTEVGERGIKLSGGQRQRLAIARGLLKQAPILILDEATSSLDSQTEKLIQEGLSHVLRDKKTTVIAIAHRLSTLENMDRIVVMNEGRLVEEGNHHDLLKQQGSLYKKLWSLQK